MEVFKPFLQRLAQPIILSFCISWVFWNWEIVVSLLWYDAQNISKLGEENHSDYIKTLDNPWRNYYWPLIFAGAYPVVILLLNNLYTFVKKYEQKLFFTISKDANVPTKLYLDAQDEIEEKERRISKFIAKESEMNSEMNELRLEYNKKSVDLNAISSELDSVKADFTSANNKVDELSSRLSVYERRSVIDNLIGYFSFSIYERIEKNKIFTLLNGHVSIEHHDNHSNALVRFITEDYEIVGEVKAYFYNIIEDEILIESKLISEATQNMTSGNYDKSITVIKNFFDSHITLRRRSNKEEIYSAYIVYPNLWIELKKEIL